MIFFSVVFACSELAFMGTDQKMEMYGLMYTYTPRHRRPSFLVFLVDSIIYSYCNFKSEPRKACRDVGW